MSDEQLVTGTSVIEARVVCQSFGKAPGHHEHKWAKEGVANVKRYAVKLTNDMTGQKAAPLELPYRIQVRSVTPWNDVDDAS